MTLLVTQRQYSGSEIFLGEFKDLKEIYKYFGQFYGRYDLAHRFSHNPMEYYVPPHWQFYSNDIYIATTFCMVIKNYKEIRYSRDFVQGMFRKFYNAERTYRRLYIPGTKRRHRRSYRAIRTFQERRYAVNVLEEEFEPKWRNSRNNHNLPNSWDDIGYSDWRDRSWKCYRKHQWK